MGRQGEAYSLVATGQRVRFTFAICRSNQERKELKDMNKTLCAESGTCLQTVGQLKTNMVRTGVAPSSATTAVKQLIKKKRVHRTNSSNTQSHPCRLIQGVSASHRGITYMYVQKSTVSISSLRSGSAGERKKKKEKRTTVDNHIHIHSISKR